RLRLVRVCLSRSPITLAWRPSDSRDIRTHHSPRRSKRSCLARSSRAPISFTAARATARQVAAVEDRIADRLPVAAIQSSPRNPRQRVEGIAELADSLRAHGLLQPVVVRPSGAGYELIAGHRRLEAAKL